MPVYVKGFSEQIRINAHLLLPNGISKVNYIPIIPAHCSTKYSYYAEIYTQAYTRGTYIAALRGATSDQSYPR